MVQDRPNMSMEDLIQEVTPIATGLVPDKCRRDLTKDVQKFLEKNANEY